MTANTLDTAFGELLHLNLIEEFRMSSELWTRRRLAAAYERALTRTMQDGAPPPPLGSLEATILGLQAHHIAQQHSNDEEPATPLPALQCGSARSLRDRS